MSTSIEKQNGTYFLAFPEMKELLLSEISARFNWDISSAVHYGDLVYFSDAEISCGGQQDSSGEPPASSAEPSESLPKPQIVAGTHTPYWARTALLNPFILHFDSIGEAANVLKGIQRNWAPYQFTCFRRASLIQDKLPYINLKPKKFPVEIPHSPVGLYTLLDEHTLVASAETTSCLPAGTLQFVEDHENPPSRAYLKIQESLSLAHHFFGVEFPHEGQRCFEAGACPGGWTWVLVNQGAEVFAVDRAELAPSLMKNPLVKFAAHDAFTLTPEEIGNVDWVLSDVICYPERLFEWVNKWLSSGRVKNMICTIKMQGEINWPLVEQFASIPDSRVVHLNYNKHELTWIHCGK